MSRYTKNRITPKASVLNYLPAKARKYFKIYWLTYKSLLSDELIYNKNSLLPVPLFESSQFNIQ